MTRAIPDMKSIYLCRRFIFLIVLLPGPLAAQWANVTHRGNDQASPTTIARTTNQEGYSLEIYRDTGNAIRSRLTMASDLLNIAEKSCPTYQIDNGHPRNRSINEAPCISNSQWAEFILGHVENGKIESSTLRGLMLGNRITFRFILDNGDYRETTFSLSGSMVAMQSAFGRNIVVTESR